MRIVQKIVDFYIDASIHVALAITCLVYLSELTQEVNYTCVVFLGTVVAYNFLKYIELIVVKKVFSSKIKGIIVWTIFSFLAFLYFFFNLNMSEQWSVLLTGLMVLLYPFLRKHGAFKLFWVGVVITIVTVCIPLSCLPVEKDCLLTTIQRFLFVISLMVPFEIYDSQWDEKSLHTFPQRFGIKKTKLLGMLLLIPFMVLEYLKKEPSTTVIPIGLITLLAIHFTSLSRSKYYTSFWVESIPIIGWVLEYSFS